MEIVYIQDSANVIFGFLKMNSAICAQGSSKEEVENKIKLYYNSFLLRNN